MTQLSYSFCMSMLHSLWQAGLLLLLYVMVDRVLIRNSSPLAKRNLLFGLLITQFILFISTFLIYLVLDPGSFNTGGIGEIAASLVPAERLSVIMPWLFGAYIFIVAYKLLKAFYTWFHFRQQYLPGLQKPDIELKLFTELKAHQFGIKRKVKLWLSTTINTPVTFGFFKPVILLPVALLNNISAKQAETLILHELTHIQTNDYLLNWFLLVAETIFFFNPFVASVCKRIRFEREKNCDVRVIAFQYPPALYAATLLQAERIKQMVPGFQLAAVSRKKQLLHRIQFFTNEKNISSQKKINFVAPLLGLVLFFALYTVTLFNSGKSAPVYLAASNPANIFPVSNTEYNDAVFNNPVLPEIKAKDLNAVLARVEKQKKAIDKQVRKMQPLIRLVEQKAQQIAEQAVQNFVMPVAEIENDAARQIIIKEESSGSRSASVKVYSLVFENGQWLIKPDWMAAAKELSPADTFKTHDTSRKKIKKVSSPQ